MQPSAKQIISHRLNYLKKRRRYKEMQYIQNNRDLFISILQSDNNISLTENSVWVLKKVGTRWFYFNKDLWTFEETFEFNNV